MAEGPFHQRITDLVNRLEGGAAGLLMGFDGITLDTYARPEHAAALPDLQTMAMEFAHVVAQARRTLQSLDAGALEEFTLKTEKLTLAVRVLTTEYFLACAILPSGNLGKTRYLMRLTAPALSAEL